MKIIKIISLLILVLSVISCDNKYEANEPEEQETINSGKLKVYCDSSLIHLMDKPFENYNKDYDKVILSKSYQNSRQVMADLLGGESRVVVNARDYLKDEDSLMKEYDVTKHRRYHFATDGLVFFVNKDFPIDTLNTKHLEESITSDIMLKDSTFGLDFEPTYAIPYQNTSVFANFNQMILNDRVLKKKLELLPNIDSVKKQIEQNNGIIGIGYLSQVIDDERFKTIKFGFYNDTTGKYDTPKPVHQSYIYMGKYPYPVKLYAYLLEDRSNLPYWFATYLYKEAKVQKYYKEKGIVPEFAEINLIFEE